MESCVFGSNMVREGGGGWQREGRYVNSTGSSVHIESCAFGSNMVREGGGDSRGEGEGEGEQQGNGGG